MMRALYSGVSGLKTHQTKMDVIGNNIANVNTVGFKSTAVTFQDIMYQKTQSASAANATTGAGGVNAKQIGLGVTTGATNVSITTEGATQTTGNPFDLKISGDSFFVVNDGTTTYFTKAGAFYVDGSGNLAMTSTGYNVMGWQVEDATGNIKQDTVSSLKIMQAKNMTSDPEATTKGTVSGIIDKNDKAYSSDSGKTLNLTFYDALGYEYTAKFSVKSTNKDGTYNVELADVLNSEGKSITDQYNAANLSDIVNFGANTTTTTTELYKLITNVQYKYDAAATPKDSYYMLSSDVLSLCKNTSDVIGGITYNAAEAVAGQGTGAATKFKASGEGSFTKDDLQKSPYNLIYQKYTTFAGGGYYYREVTTGGTTSVEIFANAADSADSAKMSALSTSIGKTCTAGEWDDLLGIKGVGATVDVTLNVDNGAATIKVTDQEFDAIDGITYDATKKIFTKPLTQAEAYGIDEAASPNTVYSYSVAPDGTAQVTAATSFNGGTLVFNTDTGAFTEINGGKTVNLNFNTNFVNKQGTTISLQNFSDVELDFSSVKWLDNGGTSTIGIDAGDIDVAGAGKKLGALTGISISNNGMIYGSYDNGNTKLLGQIAVAQFANASGLESVGNNLYQTTLNSGAFDGIGTDITADGGSISTGELEMSNVDLAAEFTEMITTQRGYQANSRIITTSDTLLEELINLKR